MRRSRFHCDRCGSSNVRRSRGRSSLDLVRMAFGSHPLRCHDCQHRFHANLLMLSQWQYARCPACLSFHLTTWDPKHYRISGLRRLLMSLGAQRFRCNVCRLNFVSFRRLRPDARPAQASPESA